MPKKRKPKSMPKSLGDRLRAARDKKKLSRTRLAFAAGLDPQYLYQIERGLRRPSLAALERLAAELGVSRGSLLD